MSLSGGGHRCRVNSGTQGILVAGTYDESPRMVDGAANTARIGQVLETNPETGTITNVTPPTQWVNPTRRPGWTL